MTGLRHRRRLRAPAFTAIVLLYLQALLPTLATLSAGERGNWLAVCTASGVRYIQIADADGETAPDHNTHASVLCPMCLSVQIGVYAAGPYRVQPVSFGTVQPIALAVGDGPSGHDSQAGAPLGARAPPIA